MDTVKRKSILRNKNFVLTALGAVVSNVGAIFYNFVVSFWILNLTGNNSVIQGLYLGITGLFFVLASPIGGIIVDRFNKAKILWICDFVRGATILATIGLVLLFSDTTSIIVILFVFGVIGNIIGAIFSPAGSSLIPEIVEIEDLQKANSISGITTGIQTIIGTTLCGLLYSILDIKIILLIVACCYIASGISEVFIKYNYVKKDENLTLKVAFRDMKETFSYIKTKNVIFVLLILIIFMNLFFNPIQQNFFPYLCVTDIASSPTFLFHEVFSYEIWQSIFSISIAIASIVVAFILSKVQLKSLTKAIKTGFILMAICALGMALSYLFLVEIGEQLNVFLMISVAICLFIGGAVVFVNVPVASMLQINVERDKFGKVMSLIQVGAQGLTPLMVFVSGLILKAGSIYLLFTLAGGLLLTAFISLFSRSLKDN